MKNEQSSVAYVAMDLVEKIQRANEMIAMHEGDEFMKSQYQRHKASFVKELGELLMDVQVSPMDIAASLDAAA